MGVSQEGRDARRAHLIISARSFRRLVDQRVWKLLDFICTFDNSLGGLIGRGFAHEMLYRKGRSVEC